MRKPTKCLNKVNGGTPCCPGGLAWLVILAAVAYFAYRFACLECGYPDGFVEFMVLGVIPAVYLTLMYLTLKSQADSERK